jgi:hypothetical protein
MASGVALPSIMGTGYGNGGGVRPWAKMFITSRIPIFTLLFYMIQVSYYTVVHRGG